MSDNTEIWKPIDDLIGYDVSNKGNIRSWRGSGPSGLLNSPHLINLCTTPTSNYWYFKITGSQRSVHREVAKAFIPNPNNLPCVNHKDEDKLNNNFSNLEWCSHRYNTTYSQGKPMRVINPQGVVLEFDSIASLAKAIGSNNGNISRFVRGIKYKNNYKGWKMYDY